MATKLELFVGNTVEGEKPSYHKSRCLVALHLLPYHSPPPPSFNRSHESRPMWGLRGDGGDGGNAGGGGGIFAARQFQAAGVPLPRLQRAQQLAGLLSPLLPPPPPADSCPVDLPPWLRSPSERLSRSGPGAGAVRTRPCTHVWLACAQTHNRRGSSSRCSWTPTAGSSRWRSWIESEGHGEGGGRERVGEIG